jgi:hypothetical protein
MEIDPKKLNTVYARILFVSKLLSAMLGETSWGSRFCPCPRQRERESIKPLEIDGTTIHPTECSKAQVVQLAAQGIQTGFDVAQTLAMGLIGGCSVWSFMFPMEHVLPDGKAPPKANNRNGIEPTELCLKVPELATPHNHSDGRRVYVNMV